MPGFVAADLYQVTAGAQWVTTTFQPTVISCTTTGGTGSMAFGNAWVQWNNEWTQIGTTTATSVAITHTWGQWSTTYIETREQEHARLLREVKTKVNQHGQNGRALDMVMYLIDDYGAEFSPDERREIIDEHQRGAETQLERVRAAAVKREEAAAAERKAEILLLTLLNEDQREEWLAFRRVTEYGQSGKVWRFFPEWAGGVAIMDGDARRATLCVHPLERVPEADNMAALLMAVRSGDEDHLIRTAILHGGQWTPDELALRRGRVVERVPAHGGQVERLVG